jgi:shikimate kinase
LKQSYRLRDDKENVVLFGFMGSGKTTVGHMLAECLGFQFVDLDNEIEAEAGCSISEIFSYEGEAGFRKRELTAARLLADRSGLVIATGGGAVKQPEAIAAFGRTGLLVCLQVDAEECARRVLNARHRPLIEAESPEARRERIRNLLAERAPLYAAIPIQVKTSREPVKKVVRKVLSAVTEPIPSKTDNTLE